MAFLGGTACTYQEAKDKAKLKGAWIVKSTIWCGDPVPLSGEESKPVMWIFSEETFESFVGLEPSGSNKGTYKIDPKQVPKHLDLTFSEGEAPGTQKCIYALDGDDLRIAFSLTFEPSTPEQESKRAKEMAERRPTSFEPKKEDLTMILLLKRQKE
jgi:uncharacterized protein (TIGR03067 family)